MNKRLTWTELTLNLKNPFTVSYGSSTTRTAYWIRLDNDEGWGEGTIPFYYGIDFKTMTDYWDRAAQKQEPFPESIEEIPQWIDKTAPSPAQTALDIAFYDRIGKQQQNRSMSLGYQNQTDDHLLISIDIYNGAMADSIQNYPYQDQIASL